MNCLLYGLNAQKVMRLCRYVGLVKMLIFYEFGQWVLKIVSIASPVMCLSLRQTKVGRHKSCKDAQIIVAADRLNNRKVVEKSVDSTKKHFHLSTECRSFPRRISSALLPLSDWGLHFHISSLFSPATDCETTTYSHTNMHIHTLPLTMWHWQSAVEYLMWVWVMDHSPSDC